MRIYGNKDVYMTVLDEEFNDHFTCTPSLKLERSIDWEVKFLKIKIIMIIKITNLIF